MDWEYGSGVGTGDYHMVDSALARTRPEQLISR